MQLTPPLSLSQDLFDQTSPHLSNGRVFLSFFGKIPSVLRIDDINEAKAIAWIQSNFVILHQHYVKKWQKKKFKIINLIVILQNEILLNIDDNNVYIYFSGNVEVAALDILNKLKKFRHRGKREERIHLVVSEFDGLTTKSVKLQPRPFVLAEHYNDDLTLVHERVVQLLRKQNNSGLVLFHGAPGTGKSTYIRSLIKDVRKKVLFLAPGLAASFDTPSMCRLLLDNSNSIIVIEEAEELIMSRERTRSSAISMLLNITDGLLGASLGIQVVATFNTNLKNIDPALMRKGRLLLRYEFKPLSAEKAVRLLRKRGIDNLFTHEPMTLAEIYNAEQDSQELLADYQSIGFRSNNSVTT